MLEQIKQVTARIRELREIYSVPAEKLAADLGISLEKYSEYENGVEDIPVSILYKIANRFGVELTELITGKNPKLQTYCLVRKGKGVSIERRKEYKYQNLAYNFINKKAEPFLVTVEPKPDDYPINYNTHPGQEFNYMIEGEMLLYIDDYEILLREGDSLFFDSGIKHGMKAVGNKPAKFLAIIM